MRGWIGEGRVNGQSLIWRDGWAEWKKADGVFAQLTQPAAQVTPSAAPAKSVPSVASAAAAIAAPAPPSAAPSITRADEPRPIALRRRSNVPTVIAVLAMTALLVLSAGFLFFITRD